MYKNEELDLALDITTNIMTRYMHLLSPNDLLQLVKYSSNVALNSLKLI